MKCALVTGGAGFVGSHLTELLLARGVSVTVLDDLSTGRWQNIAHLKDHPGLRVLIDTAANADLLNHEVPRHDFVFHLASAVGVKLILERPVDCIDEIFATTAQVMRSCSRYHVPVLLTSTSEVYGKSSEVPFTEGMDVVLGPTQKSRWLYAYAKALDEFLALAYHNKYGLPVYVVRLFNTVGPKQSDRYGMVLPTFVRQALGGKPVTVYGDGRQARCFGSVHDVVRGLVALSNTPNAVGQVVNLGTTESVTMHELATKVIEACGSKSSIELVPYDKAYPAGFDDVRSRIPCLDEARRLIGWNPQWDLKRIIEDLVRYERAWFDRPVPRV